jgi:hypothetical protein
MLILAFPVESQDQLKTIDDYYSGIDYSCSVDSDCEIKNVGNGCGYFPNCVNKNAITDPDFIAEAYTRAELTSVCGFPSIDNCICVDNVCKGSYEGQIRHEQGF